MNADRKRTKTKPPLWISLYIRKVGDSKMFETQRKLHMAIQYKDEFLLQQNMAVG